MENYYKLVRIDSTAINEYNYFEFVRKRKKYKVLSSKSIAISCMDTCRNYLIKSEYYELKLYRLGYIAVDDTDLIDLLKVSIQRRNGNIKFGGHEEVYMSKNICGTKYCKPISK